MQGKAILPVMGGEDPDPARVLDFWFGNLDANGQAAPEVAKRWWMKNPAFDREIREAFGQDHAAIVAGGRETWLATPRGRLAYVIVLDQFSRNMFRDTADAFAHDAQALHATLGGIERGDDHALAFDERTFLYMPLMHSEDLGPQDRLVGLLTRWRDALATDQRTRLEGTIEYARRHRAIVARFGRFPHRNAVLGRTSTPEEIEFLKQPGSSF